ncbi:hypothetical protein K438DRAFT_1779576 [Mycena galopus ATCC 62051]|nr:hypothetical protein K438DRAFT_1779576 [Mycena galopus ATCC 62051]
MSVIRDSVRTVYGLIGRGTGLRASKYAIVLLSFGPADQGPSERDSDLEKIPNSIWKLDIQFVPMTIGNVDFLTGHKVVYRSQHCGFVRVLRTLRGMMRVESCRWLTTAGTENFSTVEKGVAKASYSRVIFPKKGNLRKKVFFSSNISLLGNCGYFHTESWWKRTEIFGQNLAHINTDLLCSGMMIPVRPSASQCISFGFALTDAPPEKSIS